MVSWHAHLSVCPCGTHCPLWPTAATWGTAPSLPGTGCSRGPLLTTCSHLGGPGTCGVVSWPTAYSHLGDLGRTCCLPQPLGDLQCFTFTIIATKCRVGAALLTGLCTLSRSIYLALSGKWWADSDSRPFTREHTWDCARFQCPASSCSSPGQLPPSSLCQ